MENNNDLHVFEIAWLKRATRHEKWTLAEVRDFVNELDIQYKAAHNLTTPFTKKRFVGMIAHLLQQKVEGLHEPPINIPDANPTELKPTPEQALLSSELLATHLLTQRLEDCQNGFLDLSTSELTKIVTILAKNRLTVDSVLILLGTAMQYIEKEYKKTVPENHVYVIVEFLNKFREQLTEDLFYTAKTIPLSQKIHNVTS